MDPFDELVANNRRYAETFSGSDLAAAPVKKLAVLTCMDARIDVHKVLGLEPGEAHVLRNAGGAVTDDAIRSLLISSILGPNTLSSSTTPTARCALHRRRAEDTGHCQAGVLPPFDLGAMEDLDQGLRDSVAAIDQSPYLRFATVKGFVYDVVTGLVREAGA